MPKSVFTAKEVKAFVGMIKRLVPGKFPQSVFIALMSKLPSIPVDLALLNKQNRVLLIRRSDKEFRGEWLHFPGTVWRFGETISEALQRLRQGELKNFEMTEPEFFGHIEIFNGKGCRLHPTRHELSLFHFARLKRLPPGDWIFAPINKPPANLLPHQFLHFDRLKVWL